MIRTFSAVLLFAALVSTPSIGFSATYYVPDDFGTIQAAIDAAADLYTIIVRDGTWTGPDNKDLDFNGKEISLRSENGPASCIIDCEGDGKGFYFQNNETNMSVLDGFTIINGYADHGAISCFYSSPTIANCIISGNTASPSGGAGIHCYSSSPIIRDCEITGNSTESSSGGAIKCVESSSPTIIRCNLSGNSSAVRGGGIACFDSSPYIASCTITGNESVSYGGGVFCYGSSDPIITNCTISENTASQGGGIFCAGDTAPQITNSVLWGNSAPIGNEISLISYEFPSSLTVEYSDVEGGEAAADVEPECTLIWGDGNIDQDPSFVGGGDYHLAYDSPCIDSGTDSGIYIDIDGDSRPLGAGYDMGSDEYGGPEIALSLFSLSSSCEYGTNATSQGFEIWNSSGQTLTYSISDDVDWLYCDPADGDSTGEHDTITVYYTTSALVADSYSATITVSGVASNSPQEISVSLEVFEMPEISVSQVSLVNSCEEGTDATSQNFEAWNSGSGTLFYSVSDDVDWLYCTPENGSSVGEQDTITVHYSTGLLDPGNYLGTIAISDPDAINTPQEIPVSLEVIPVSEISTYPASFTNSCNQGTNAVMQGLAVWNSGNGTLSYSVSDDADWLYCDPTTGTSTGEADSITVYYTTSGLPAGNHSATITISDPNSTNGSLSVPVELTVIPGELTRISCQSPANESVLSSVPTFTWTTDGGTRNAYAVDMALSLSGPISGPVYSTPILYETSWTMPENIWNRIPSGSFVYWRVRGADLDATPLTVIYSTETRWFYKP